MALDIPSSQAVSFAVSGARAAGRLASPATTSLPAPRALELGEGLRAGRFVERSVTINTADASRALQQSLSAGTTIRSALRQLEGLARLAEQEGLVSSDTRLLSQDGTRVSRGNIQAQLDRAVALIDGLVSASANGSANFIDGNGPAIRVQTSRYGGSVAIAPQGLDSASLGIASLDVSDSAQARASAARIEAAIITAGARLDRLAQLSAALNQSSAFDRSLVTATADISGTLPAGAFVDLSA